MSKIALSAPVAGAGTATIKGPETATDKEYSLPDAEGEVVTKGTLNVSGDAPMFACRAWVNFDGTKDSTGAASTANTARLIRASGNVSSVVRNGAGDYTVNFTTAMPDANYAVSLTGTLGVGSADANFLSGLSRATASPAVAASVRVVTGVIAAGPAATPIDVPIAVVTIFR